MGIQTSTLVYISRRSGRCKTYITNVSVTVPIVCVKGIVITAAFISLKTKTIRNVM